MNFETLMRLWQGTLGPQAPEQLNPYEAQDRELQQLMLAANQPQVLPIPAAGLVPQRHVQTLPGAMGVPQTLQAPFGMWSDSAMTDFIGPLQREMRR
jgi:hypothetical protein